VRELTRKQRVMLAVVPPLVAALVRVLGATWRTRDINAPGTPNGDTIPGPTIFAFWHCSLLACAHRFRNRGIAILISQSFDGELIARVVERLGFTAVRGSSTRGGASALRGMQQAYSGGAICAFTADGPKGPARIAKPGPVQLAELAGATWIGAFHAQPDRAWIMNSWDHFMIPKPFATITFTWPEHVAPDLALIQQALDHAVSMSTAKESLIPNR
jgi:lysophospholipid acyltransferase (LPLAT)-like uncharacterized protein